MHIAESFALASAAKLNNQRLYERFAPVGSNKYISFHKIHYDQYQEVLNLIQPVLKNYGIDIIQIGGTNYPKILSIPKIKDYTKDLLLSDQINIYLFIRYITINIKRY